MKIGENIRRSRKALKLSQEHVAEQLGGSRQAVSKWETDQSEPTANNLVELAKLFDMSVSQLVEPERDVPETLAKGNLILRRNLEIVTVGCFTGAVLLLGIQPEDIAFQLYASILRLLLAAVMAVNILRLPQDIRLKMALWELGYCIAVHCVMVWLSPVIGNVFSAAIVLVLCVFYGKWIRFRENLPDCIPQ